MNNQLFQGVWTFGSRPSVLSGFCRRVVVFDVRNRLDPVPVFEDVGVEGDAVDDRSDQAGVGEDLEQQFRSARVDFGRNRPRYR